MPKKKVPDKVPKPEKVPDDKVPKPEKVPEDKVPKPEKVPEVPDKAYKNFAGRSPPLTAPRSWRFQAMKAYWTQCLC